MSHLSIQLLGAFQAQLDGKPVTELKTDKTRALLSYLAVEAGTPYRRESLAALLWPECSEEAASRSLRQALSQLNHALETTSAAPTFLTITRTSVAFNRDSDYDLDVTAFVDAILTSRQHRHRRLDVCQLCIKRLHDAVALYRGDFLEGLIPHNSQPFEEWRSFQQEQYHQQVLEALYALTCYHENRREYAQAIAYARRQVALEPWREEAHRQLMRSLALNGQRSMAIAQYQACRRVLERELGIPPEDATQTLYTQIKSGRPAEEVLQIGFTPNNLPAQVTPFIGREEELRRIAERLSSLDCRLITLIGMGGNGKTRLALQAAEEALGTFRDGIYFIPLAPLKSTDSLAAVILETLQTAPPAETLPEEQLLNALRDKEVLLILDSFEHLTGNAPLLLRLLTRAPHLKLLVTSRERLNMQGEQLVEVKGLPVPDVKTVAASAPVGKREEPWEAFQGYSALRLFVQSAQRIRPDFDPAALPQEAKYALIQICQLLLGNPLAIELAATWVRALSCEEIAEKIAQDLSFLTAFLQNAPAQQRDLHTVFNHSWELLSEKEKTLFSQLAAFQGTFDHHAAAVMTNATPHTLLALVDKSLLQQTTPGRYAMHDLLHQYAAEKLHQDPDMETSILMRHAAYYTTFLESQITPLKGEGWQEAKTAVAAEIDNIRAAWHWALSHISLHELSQAADSLAHFYDISGWFQEGNAVFKEAAEVIQEHFDTQAEEAGAEPWQRLLCKIAMQWGHFSLRQGDFPMAIAAAKLALEQSRYTHDREDEAWIQILWGRALFAQGDYQTAHSRFTRVITMEQSQKGSLQHTIGLLYLGETHQAVGNLAAARQCYQEVLKDFEASTLAPSAGYHQMEAVARALNDLGDLYDLEGNYLTACDYYEQASAAFHDIGDREREAWVLSNLSLMDIRIGDYTAAQQRIEETLQIEIEVGNRQGEAAALNTLAQVLYHTGKSKEARSLLRQALTISRQIGIRSEEADILTTLGHVFTALGRLENATEVHEQALRLRRELGQSNRALENLAGMAEAARRRGRHDEAFSRVEESLKWIERHEIADIDLLLTIYLTAYRVLIEVGQAQRAGGLLESAYRLLQSKAAEIQSETLRALFLSNVAIHRDIVTTWEGTKSSQDAT